MALKALIFDIDGTVANTEDEHLLAFNKAFKDMGLDWFWSFKLYKELLITTGGRERIKYYLQNYKPEFSTKNLDDFIADVHKLKTKYFIDTVKRGDIPFRCGIKRLLLEAKAKNIILAIATTTNLDNVSALLRANLGYNALDYFSFIAAGNAIKNKKPAGDIYSLTLDKLNLLANECLAFEDSENGLNSAKKAGIKTIITTSRWTKMQNFDSALLVLNNLGEPDKEFRLINSVIGSVSGFVDVAMLKRIYAKAY